MRTIASLFPLGNLLSIILRVSNPLETSRPYYARTPPLACPTSRPPHLSPTPPCSYPSRIAPNSPPTRAALGASVTGVVGGLTENWIITLVVLSMAPIIALAVAALATVMMGSTKRQNAAYAKAGGIATEW